MCYNKKPTSRGRQGPGVVSLYFISHANSEQGFKLLFWNQDVQQIAYGNMLVYYPLLIGFINDLRYKSSEIMHTVFPRLTKHSIHRRRVWRLSHILSLLMLPSLAIGIIINTSFLVGNWTWTASQVVFTTGKFGNNFDTTPIIRYHPKSA